jgi:hypothetical protein
LRVQVREGCVPRLLALVTCGHMELAVTATAALAAAAGCAAGTEALLASGEATLFAELLDWVEPRLERNVLALVANAATHPAMRQLFKVRRCAWSFTPSSVHVYDSHDVHMFIRLTKRSYVECAMKVTMRNADLLMTHEQSCRRQACWTTCRSAASRITQTCGALRRRPTGSARSSTCRCNAQQAAAAVLARSCSWILYSSAWNKSHKLDSAATWWRWYCSNPDKAALGHVLRLCLHPSMQSLVLPALHRV